MADQEAKADKDRRAISQTRIQNLNLIATRSQLELRSSVALWLLALVLILMGAQRSIVHGVDEVVVKVNVVHGSTIKNIMPTEASHLSQYFNNFEGAIIQNLLIPKKLSHFPLPMPLYKHFNRVEKKKGLLLSITFLSRTDRSLLMSHQELSYLPAVANLNMIP